MVFLQMLCVEMYLVQTPPSFINAEINTRLEEISDLIDKEEYKVAKEKLNAIEHDLNASTQTL